jgi:hypothetical protein
VEIQLTGDLAERRKRLFAAYVEEVMRRRKAPFLGYGKPQVLLWLESLSLSALSPANAFPLRRGSFARWSFSPSRSVPPARSLVYFSRVLPLILVSSVMVGIILPVVQKFGTIAGLALLLQSSGAIFFLLGMVKYEPAATPDDDPLAGFKIWVVSLVIGGSLGEAARRLLELALASSLHVPYIVLCITAGLALVIGAICIFLFLERTLSEQAIEPVGWLLIVLACFAIYLITKWKQSAVALQYGLTAGAALTLTTVPVYLLCYFAVATSNEEPKWAKKSLRFSALLLSACIPLIAVLGIISGSDLQFSGSTLVLFTAYPCGLVLGTIIALPITGILQRSLPFHVVLAIGGLLPFRLKRFLSYSVDRSIIRKDVTGYRFIHAMLQTYFATRSEAGRAHSDLMREWEY